MTVGEALAQARDGAGLSVEDVSGRTGIRETVIRDIEHDDFGALGGDLYVRGYLRAIAGAIGMDAQPLIREFDAARAASRAQSSAAAPGTPPPTTTPALTAETPTTPVPVGPPSAHPGPAPADEDYSSLWWADDAVSDADPAPVTRVAPGSIPFGALASPARPADDAAPWSHAPEPGQAARPPRRPARQPRPRTAPRSRVRGWRWVTTISVLTAVVLGIAGVATSQIVAKLRSPGHAGAAATPTVRPAAENSQAPVPPATPAATSPAAVTPSPTQATPTPPPAVRLSVRSASAFGPNGLADGDNPQAAGNVITPGAALPWQTDWYATPTFGMLKDGTGVLLDMGKPVTITSVQVRLGSIRGANLQVRAGNAASLSAAPVVASAQDAAGTLTVQLKKPARARYVILWFTQLPPSGNGNYQATIYSATINGHP